MRKFSVIIAIIIVMISILMPITVFATGAFQVELASDKAEAKEGETVIISISLANLNVTTGEQGIGAYLAKIDYDTEIFEKAIFSGNENWEGGMENGNIAGVTVDGKVAKQAEIIATLSLTVKENAKVGNTTITVSNFVGSDAVNDISANTKSIDINVIEENQNQNQEDSSKDETNAENNTNSESNITDNNNTNSSVGDNTNSNSNANNNNTNSNVSDNTSGKNEANNSANSNVSNATSGKNEANQNSTNGNASDATGGKNEANNSTNSDVSNAANSNIDTNNNSDTDTTDHTLSNEQAPQAGNKIWLYGGSIVILLALIAVAIYICYRKVKLKGKIDKLKENSR